MRVEVQGLVDAALERLVHDEVERAQVLELEALDPAPQQLRKLGPRRSGVSCALIAA